MSKNSFSVLPSQKRPKNSVARASLIAAVQRLLKTSHPSEITTAMVLAEANVARGTLYLHFEDFSDLMETVLLEMFSTSVEENINSFRRLVEASSTKHAFLTGVNGLLKESQGPDRRGFRFGRLRLLAYSEQNPRFARLLSKEQARLNRAFEEIFVRMREKGWLSKTPELASVVIFVQAFTLGQIVDDVAEEKMSSEGWNHLIGKVVEKVLLDH